MNPHQMYAGQAPAAMSQMGQGLNEVGARIGQSIQQGYEGLGKGLAQGVAAAAGAYTDYKQAKTSNDMFKIMVDDPAYRDMLGIARGEQGDADAEALKKNHDIMIKQHGQVGGAQFANQFLSPIHEYYAKGREYDSKIQQALAQTEEDRLLKDARRQEALANARALGRKNTGMAPMPYFGDPYSSLRGGGGSGGGAADYLRKILPQGTQDFLNPAQPTQPTQPAQPGRTNYMQNLPLPQGHPQSDTPDLELFQTYGY